MKRSKFFTTLSVTVQSPGFFPASGDVKQTKKNSAKFCELSGDGTQYVQFGTRFSNFESDSPSTVYARCNGDKRRDELNITSIQPIVLYALPTTRPHDNASARVFIFVQGVFFGSKRHARVRRRRERKGSRRKFSMNFFEILHTVRNIEIRPIAPVTARSERGRGFNHLALATDCGP